MDGASCLYRLRQLLNEDANSAFLDDRTSYDFINSAAIEFVERTSCLKSTQSITTVADQREHTLNADFIKLYLKDKNNRLYCKYNDGSSSYSDFIYFKPYEEIIYEDNVDSVSDPTHFTIIDDATLDSQVTGTTTSAGAASGGQSTLTDTGADFSDVSAGDMVHNTDDGSVGVVLSKTSPTVLVTALFGGTDDDWTSSDAYVIQPQGRLQFQFDPPPSTSSHTVTVYYIQRPAPVYSDYGVFRLQPQHMEAILKYAAFNYKYRDQDPNFGDAYFQHWENELKKSSATLNNAFGRNRIKVNMKVRR